MEVFGQTKADVITATNDLVTEYRQAGGNTKANVRLKFFRTANFLPPVPTKKIIPI